MCSNRWQIPCVPVARHANQHCNRQLLRQPAPTCPAENHARPLSSVNCSMAQVEVGIFFHSDLAEFLPSCFFGDLPLFCATRKLKAREKHGCCSGTTYDRNLICSFLELRNPVKSLEPAFVSRTMMRARLIALNFRCLS